MNIKKDKKKDRGNIRIIWYEKNRVPAHFKMTEVAYKTRNK
jgi:hypothetical protein